MKLSLASCNFLSLIYLFSSAPPRSHTHWTYANPFIWQNQGHTHIRNDQNYKFLYFNLLAFRKAPRRQKIWNEYWQDITEDKLPSVSLSSFLRTNIHWPLTQKRSGAKIWCNNFNDCIHYKLKKFWRVSLI